MKLVDLTDRLHADTNKVLVNPDEIAAMVCDNSSYREQTRVILKSGKEVRVGLGIDHITQRIEEARVS